MPTDHDVPQATRDAPGAPLAPVVLGQETTDAERSRTLAASAGNGVLSTLACDEGGIPYGSLAPFGLDSRARPVFCISELAEHTRNLRADPRSSLLIAQAAAPGGDPLANARLTLMGRSVEVPAEDRAEAKAAHLAGNPHASYYIDFGDFSLWWLEVSAIRYVGGYGRMSWVDVDGWHAAEPDPVEPYAAGAIEHLNADHADACLLMAQHLGRRPDATAAVVTGIDRYGLDLVATGPGGPGRVRLGFDEVVATPDAIRAATVTLTRRARSAAGSAAEA
jgi:putative heme iron utilization protein